MDKLKLYIYAAVISASIAFGAWGAYRMAEARVQAAETATSEAQREAKALRSELEANRLAEAVRESQRARVARATKENHDRTETALAASPDWAAQPVPRAVLDSLRDAARADPSGAPQRVPVRK